MEGGCGTVCGISISITSWLAGNEVRCLTSSRYSDMICILPWGTTSSQNSVDGIRSTNVFFLVWSDGTSFARCEYPSRSHRRPLASVPEIAKKLHPALRIGQICIHRIESTYHGEV